jgi:hypothetical protein
MARALVVTGLDPERAYLIARRADRDLAERGAVSLDSSASASSRRADRRRGGGADGATAPTTRRAPAHRGASSATHRGRDRDREVDDCDEAAHRLGITA